MQEGKAPLGQASTSNTHYMCYQCKLAVRSHTICGALSVQSFLGVASSTHPGDNRFKPVCYGHTCDIDTLSENARKPCALDQETS